VENRKKTPRKKTKKYKRSKKEVKKSRRHTARDRTRSHFQEESMDANCMLTYNSLGLTQRMRGKNLRA